MRVLVLLALLLVGCNGSTGSALVSFSATASGPTDATGGPLSFTSGVGAQVTLTQAKQCIGAVFLNQSVPTSGAASQPCISAGIDVGPVYVGQVFGPVEVDLLSPTPQPFPGQGEGTQTQAKTAEVWLSGGDINAAEDSTVILNLEGTAIQAGQTFPFVSEVTIGSNRKQQVTNPALPSASPICRQRIVAPILVDITPTDGGSLAIHVDPRPMFNAVDFTTLTKSSDAPLLYRIADDNVGAGGALFKGMLANWGVYTFQWNESGQ